MNHSIFAAILSLSICATAVHAVPYCDALMDTSKLPEKYKKKGPFHSDSEQGWVIANDQLITGFEFGEDAHFLMTKIAQEFLARGVKLVLAVPPPRPLFMSAPIEGYDHAKAANSFRSYLKRISSTGVITPDLLTLMKSSLGEAAYFQRDTHWTPQGAAFSAINLAHQLGEVDDLGIVFTNLSFAKTYSEKGSLTAVVDEICKTELKPEQVSVSSFSKHGSSSDLLSDVSNDMQTIALAGTSFSNRYSRDVYRFSDALSFALDTPIENYSISGGGIISALETLILSDAFFKGTYRIVIWEVPYTQNLSDTHGLRQILGALHASGHQKSQDVYNGSVGADWQSLPLSLNTAGEVALLVKTNSAEISQIDIQLYDQDNQKTRFKLRKSKRVPTQLQSDIWSASLVGLKATTFSKMKIRLKNAKSNQTLSVSLVN